MLKNCDRAEKIRLKRKIYDDSRGVHQISGPFGKILSLKDLVTKYIFSETPAVYIPVSLGFILDLYTYHGLYILIRKDFGT